MPINVKLSAPEFKMLEIVIGGSIDAGGTVLSVNTSPTSTSAIFGLPKSIPIVDATFKLTRNAVAVGASFTGITLMETVASSDVHTPSVDEVTVNLKLSEPL